MVLSFQHQIGEEKGQIKVTVATHVNKKLVTWLTLQISQVESIDLPGTKVFVGDSSDELFKKIKEYEKSMNNIYNRGATIRIKQD